MEEAATYNKKTKQPTIQKTVRIPKDVYVRIEQIAAEQERDVAKQINFMLKKYLEIMESMN